ncbi:sigma-70 family RNA polymerase sigma factor, partial [bacterium]|nr:sigma-70 family RNA polymerase sigma factor [bacterium]
MALTRGSEADRRSALEGLHALYRDEVMGFLVHFLRDAALAEDVLQEAFLSAYSGFDRFDSSRPFRPWLYQIARNTALHALRSRRKEKRVDEKGARAEPASGRIVLQAQSGEEAERAREVLASLEDDDAALLVQRH